MPFKTATLYLNDNASKYNRDLTTFLDRNIQTIVLKAHIKMDIQIAHKQKLIEIKNQGITSLPAMILDGQRYIGVPSIVNCLKRNVQKRNAPVKKRSEEETMENYMMNELGAKINASGQIELPSDTDEEENADKARTKALNKAQRAREQNTKPESRTNHSTASYQRQNNLSEITGDNPKDILANMKPREGDDLMEMMLSKMDM